MSALTQQIQSCTRAIRENNWVLVRGNCAIMKLPQTGNLKQRVQVVMIKVLDVVNQSKQGKTAEELNPRLKDILTSCVAILAESKAAVDSESGSLEKRLFEHGVVAVTYLYSISSSITGVPAHITQICKEFNALLEKASLEVGVLVRTSNEFVGDVDKKEVIKSALKALGKNAAGAAKGAVASTASSLASTASSVASAALGWIGFYGSESAK